MLYRVSLQHDIVWQKKLEQVRMSLPHGNWFHSLLSRGSLKYPSDSGHTSDLSKMTNKIT